MTSSCPWTYHLDCDESNETQSPSVRITARCLNPDLCEPVLASMKIRRWNPETEQLDEVNESFAVACRPKPIDSYNPEYTTE